jgi:hypothetical protein
MRSLSSALVVIAGVYGLLNAQWAVSGNMYGAVTYVICGTLLVFGVGGWIYCLKNDD